ncbi:MAG: hypothetical protein Q8P45_02095 [Candidatus Harrisonbacteria bacterium]|nr:hypothetical protein [Candidatus Harrisonbacteria bacterium]
MANTKVPPPPIPEVAIRTLESDARSIAAGEIDPQPEIVTPSAAVFGTSAETVKKKKKHGWLLLLIILVLALGAVIFFFFPDFIGL